MISYSRVVKSLQVVVMTAQIPLQLVQPLRYSSGLFVVHTGVRGLVSSIETLAYQRLFSLAYVEGAAKSGKTHLGVYLVGHLQSKGRPARMLSGEDVAEWYASGFDGQPLREGETIIIDDGDLFLEVISKNRQSGVFTDLTERMLQIDGTLVVLGALPPEKIACSQQIKSRLNSGLHLVIDGPEESDLDALLDLIAKQRGMQLTESKRAYLLRRVARTLPALVECVEKVEDTSDLSGSRTAYNVLADATAQDATGQPLFDRKIA
jgi:chromosomal replication initiation ATPase DnaA